MRVAIVHNRTIINSLWCCTLVKNHSVHKCSNSDSKIDNFLPQVIVDKKPRLTQNRLLITICLTYIVVLDGQFFMPHLTAV